MFDNNKICSKVCNGIIGKSGGCCKVGNSPYVLGVHFDVNKFLSDLEIKFKKKFTREEVYIDYEEGKNLFPDKAYWQLEHCYPTLRVDTNNSEFPCVFYDYEHKGCGVYDIRPWACRQFECDYLVQIKKNASLV